MISILTSLIRQLPCTKLRINLMCGYLSALKSSSSACMHRNGNLPIKYSKRIIGFSSRRYRYSEVTKQMFVQQCMKLICSEKIIHHKYAKMCSFTQFVVSLTVIFNDQNGKKFPCFECIPLSNLKMNAKDRLNTNVYIFVCVFR